MSTFMRAGRCRCRPTSVAKAISPTTSVTKLSLRKHRALWPRRQPACISLPKFYPKFHVSLSPCMSAPELFEQFNRKTFPNTACIPKGFQFQPKRRRTSITQDELLASVQPPFARSSQQPVKLDCLKQSSFQVTKSQS